MRDDSFALQSYFYDNGHEPFYTLEVRDNADRIRAEHDEEFAYESGYGLCRICDGWMPNGLCINERNSHHV